MDRRRLIRSVGALPLAWTLSANAQVVRKVARIGIVSIGGPTDQMTGPLPRNRNVRAFLKGMAELGYVFGRDFVTEPRGTDSMQKAAAELIELQVDMIVATGGGRTLQLLKQATTTIPIIMTAAPDPVREGLVQSLARPGGNFTGMSLQSLELTNKRVALLKELVPVAQTVAFFDDSTNPNLWQAAQASGRAQGLTLVRVDVPDQTKIAAAFQAVGEAKAGALFIPASGVLFSQASRIAALAAQSRLPAIYELRTFVDAGGLASYGARIEEIWQRAATYVDKLLKGAKPADMPIEQPTKFELVINLQAAKALDLTIPSSFLIRADEIIE